MMNKSSQKRWGLALGYVGLILATLEWIRIPILYLRQHNYLRLSLGILYCLTLSFVWIKIFSVHQRRWLKAVVATFIFLVVYFIGKSIGTPEEQIHFFEYGMVGILFLRAIELHVIKNWHQIFWALGIAFFTGIVDELIQGLLPHRHFDMKDIVLNLVSSCLGLLIYSLLPKHQPEKLPL